MATIGKIRKHSGLLIGIIGVALALFVLSDFMTSGNGRRSVDPIAVVFGEKISYQDFTYKVDESKELIRMRYGADIQLTAADNFQINNDVFDQMVRNTILMKECENLGLAVSDAELIHVLFANPETGTYDAMQAQQYIETLEDRPEEEQRQFKLKQNMAYEQRLQMKYQNLVVKGYYIPKAFLERDNVEKNKKYGTVYTGLKFSSISDSTLTVTDEEIKAYYDAHKYEYVYDEPVASAEFVIFDVKPSVVDLAKTKTLVDSAYAGFLRTTDDMMAVYVNSNSDLDYTWDSSYLRREVLPVKADTLFKAKPGTFVEPYMDNYVFYMHKLLDRKMIPDSLKAAHILISYVGAYNADSSVTRTKEEAQKFADSLLLVAKGTDSAAFAALAMNFSGDPSKAQNAGYMGWFPEGAMVPEFNKACLDNPNGSYVIAETVFGFHIIKVMDKTKPVEKVKIATIQKTVEPSDATSDSIFNLANVFAAESIDQATFDKLITEKGYTKRIADKVTMKDFTLAGINEGREIVRWIFNEETEKGKVSTVFSLDGEGKYVVAMLKDVKQKGEASFEDVKDLLVPFAKREKKSQMLLDKMNAALASAKTVEAVASKLETEIDSFDVTFATYSLPGYGPEPQLVGTITASAKGGLSKPVIGEMGVYVYTVFEITEATPADPKALFMQKAAFFQSKVNYELFKALERKADIEDNRILFY